MKHKISMTAISFLCNITMAGFATQFGMLIEPIATAFNASTTEVAVIFSLLNAGALAGTVAGFFVIDAFGVKRVTVSCYSLVFLFAVAMYLTHSFMMVKIYISLIGFFAGIGLCIAGTLVVKIWHARLHSTLLVVQDASFNIGGVIFPLLTTYALSQHLAWSSSYLIAGIIALLTVTLSLMTNFSASEDHLSSNVISKASPSEWNIGILMGGFGLFMVMLSLYTFLTWGPLFLEHKFGEPFIKAGHIITEYWSAALVGAVVSAIVVTRVSVRLFLVTVLAIASVITAVIVTTEHQHWLPYLAYGYGFVCSALYNTFIAYGVSFVKKPSSKNISYILIAGSTGAMVSPGLTSLLRPYLSLQTIMYAIPLFYLLTCLLLIASNAMAPTKRAEYDGRPRAA
ncbi:MFS transporter TsgA [Shewanella sp. NIFS-20-20]|uniref:MFS transporter TsgA n=1 Tax=Shewanella sp. NIFS-20-20 TaxID=2853806 RepID=UPI001C46D1E1|nr:MFS transporter TsgA [Shewanella sp. NIFS-20-20]MBV7315299.1 MFS transporter TsgA [Shewanella sp. NIFS-20-20]